MVDNVRQKMHMRLQSLIHDMQKSVQTDSRLYEPAWKSNMGFRDARRRVREFYREQFRPAFPGCIIEFRLGKGVEHNTVSVIPPVGYVSRAPVSEVLPPGVSHAVFFGCELKSNPGHKYEVT